jgi:hypothetical protein
MISVHIWTDFIFFILSGGSNGIRIETYGYSSFKVFG